MSALQERWAKEWAKMFQQLLNYKAEQGHTRVPSTYKKNKALAKWVHRQRQNECCMVRGRKKKLDSIGFCWYKDMRQMEEEVWLDQYEQLKRFYKKFGHFRVPKDNPLHFWVNRLRQLEGTMPAHRKALLDTIKFTWSRKVKAELSDNWNTKYQELVSYYKKHGNSRLNNHQKGYVKLGAWVQRQRNEWSKLDTRRRNKLKALGFITSDVIDKEKRLKWLTMLAILKRYKKENGNCRVPRRYKKNPELARWVEVQRLSEKNMAEWRKEKLHALGFEWSRTIQDSKEKMWYAMYSKLEKLYKRFHHVSVSAYWKEDPKLYEWVRHQRRWKHALTKEKISLLNRLSFEWKTVAGKQKRNELGQFARKV